MGGASIDGGLGGMGGATSGGGGAGGSAGGGSSGSSGMGGGKSDGGAGGSPVTGPSQLPVPPGPSDVAKPSGTASKVTPLHWAGFKAAVSYSFDDDNTSQIQSYTQLNALGVPFTFFMWTGKSEANNAIWKTALRDGHEIANHTKSHQSAGTVADIDAATTFIKDTFGVQPWSMAAPNGADVYTTLTKGRFFINRGVGNASIGPGGQQRPVHAAYLHSTPGGQHQRIQ